MAIRPLPDQAMLLKLLRYEPETGRLYWRERSVGMFREARNKTAEAVALTWNLRFADKEALTSGHDGGYRRGGIDGVLYLAHRVIWKMVTGDEPDQIDHINGIRSDNRFANLRAATRSENNRNTALLSSNKSGCPGVSWSIDEAKWVARISVARKRLFLGYFENKEDAVRVRKAAERQYGFHPNHGRRP